MRRVVAAVVPVLLVLLAGAATASPSAAVVGTDAGVPAPIVVLLDTSGSMNEDDGAGTLKLAGAKAAVRDIVAGLDSATVFGLWTYPGTACGGGGYVSEPAPLTDRAAVTGRVDQVVADGDTPTGVALREVADDLVARGYSTATIVLVSDGESTCGPPPCDVAEELVAEGFAVTVPTIGFRTSGDGAKELSCISSATGAQTYSASDSAELAAQLGGLVSARVGLEVRYDPAPVSGGSTRVTVVLTHGGGEDARDVRVSLTYLDPESRSGSRAGIPPVQRVGNVPAGASVQRSWTIGTGARGTSGLVPFRVTAWGSNSPPVVFERSFGIVGGAYGDLDLGPLFAHVTNETPLVVFGDSYSSGEGVGDRYDPTPVGVSASCHRSHRTYLGRVLSEQEMTILACSGAVTADLVHPSGSSTFSQIQEMTSRGIVAGAGILTFGGNDIGFPDVVGRCISPVGGSFGLAGFSGCSDLDYVKDRLGAASALTTQLTQTYERAWSAINTPEQRAARDGDHVPLFVLPYPKVTHEPRRGACYDFSAAEVIVAEALATRLNDSVEQAVGAARAAGYEVYYVSDVEDAVRPDHTLCAPGPFAYINGWLKSGPPSFFRSESVHPKVSGYLAETDAIVRWAASATPMTPAVTDERIRADLADVAGPVPIVGPTPVPIANPPSSLMLELGGTIRPQGSGYEPGSVQSFALYSEPWSLGVLRVDEDGTVDGVLTLPDTIPLGQHTLVVTGFDADGAFAETRIPVSIVAPTPPWVWAALLGAVVCLLGGIAAIVVSRLPIRRRTAPSETPAG